LFSVPVFEAPLLRRPLSLEVRDDSVSRDYETDGGENDRHDPAGLFPDSLFKAGVGAFDDGSEVFVHTGLHEFGLSGIARAGSLCGGVAGWGGRVLGGRGEGSVEFGHFGALLLEFRLMRKGVAEAGLEARQPSGGFSDGAALFRELDLETPER
jgi:hypothetical protein